MQLPPKHRMLQPGRVLSVLAMATCVLLAGCVQAAIGAKAKPSIIFMLADDLGYNNIGYQQMRSSGKAEVSTPTIDALANSGMVLDRMYSYKYCSPSRSSFLSGRLPIHVTQNNKNNLVTNPGGADLRMKLLPQMLKSGSHPYYTAIVGKWHVGARSRANLPINRGFDTHFGFLKGGEDHINQYSDDAGITFVDLWRDHSPAAGENGTFSTIMYAREAQRIIRDHATNRQNQSLFMYLSWQAAHAPLEAPSSWKVKSVPNDTSENTRAKMNALVEVLDEGVRNVTQTLRNTGMWNNTLLVFQADNGGWITRPTWGGNNYPLRGGKVSDFEGGTRTFTLVNGGFLPENLRGSRNKGLAHICDWYATFLSLAGIPRDQIQYDVGYALGDVVPPVDSLDLWPTLIVPNTISSPRDEIPLSFCNEVAECDTPGSIGDSALIVGEWKIVNGTQAGLGIWQGTQFPNATSVAPADPGCPQGCLFNIRKDPNEHNDVKDDHPKLFKRLMARLKYHGSTVFQTNYSTADVCESAAKSFADNKGFLSPRCRQKGKPTKTSVYMQNGAHELNKPSLPAAYDLKTEYLPSKYALSLGSQPRFSWKIPVLAGEASRGIDQSAYRLIVKRSNSDKGIVWDSGIVKSNDSSLVQFGGNLNGLSPDTSYTWTVQWFSDSEDNPSLNQMESSQVSQVSTFDIGLGKEADWEGAVWIGAESHRMIRVTTPSLPFHISRARVHVAAPGCFVMSVNGARHKHTASGICPWTNFNKTIYYYSLDVLPLLQSPSREESTEEAFGFMLGHGMYTHATGHKPAVKIKITFESDSGDPKERFVCTSGVPNACTWIGTEGPYISDDPFAGAIIDWNKLPLDWDTVKFDPAAYGWTLVPLVDAFPYPNAIVKGMLMPPTVDKKVFKPISVRRLDEYGGAVWLFDIGTNIVGTCKVTVTKNIWHTNATVRLRHGEILLNNGSLNFNYSNHDTGVKAHFQEDVHFLRRSDANEADRVSDSTEELRSAFVWYGFQFVSVQVSHEDLFQASLENIECYQMYPDMGESSHLAFGDDALSGQTGKKLNALNHIVRVSQLGNLAQYAPTDCPTREKHFWLGDAMSIAEEAMMNFDVAPLFANFLSIIADEQGHDRNYPQDVPPVIPVLTSSGEMGVLDANRLHQRADPKSFGITDVSWGSGFPVILNWMWRHYGDSRIVKQLYHATKDYVNFLEKEALAHLNSSLVEFYQFGDWCSNQSREIARNFSGPPSASFSYIMSLDAMAEMANVLGLHSDADRFRSLATQLRHEWHLRNYNESHQLYGYEAEDGYAVQTLTTAPLAMGGVIPDNLLKGIIEGLSNDVTSVRAYHQTFGSVGAKHFFTQLSNHGMHRTAIKVATQDTFPSFGYWIKQGATSCWENWSGKSDATHPPQPTHNHIFLCGGVGEWMYTHVAGVSLPVSPGFAQILLSPQISIEYGPSSSVSSVHTPYGSVQTNWSRVLPNKNLHTYGGVNISFSVPKVTTLSLSISMLSSNNGVSTQGNDFIVSESGHVIWKNGHFVPGVVHGVHDAKFEIDKETWTVTTSRGIFDFELRIVRAL